MSWEEVRQISREEGFAAGIAQGRTEGISKARQDVILEHLSVLGEVPEELRTRITTETDIDVLKAMTTALFQAGSVPEFETLISNLS